VEVLKVKHIIVCGHYGCGGIRAAMTDQKFGILDEWLSNIKKIYSNHASEIQNAGDEQAQVNRLVELNVLAQLRSIARTEVVQKTWALEQRPTLHGWVFNMADGRLSNLYKIDPSARVEDL
jgi:carbonic anhydrase